MELSITFRFRRVLGGNAVIDELRSPPPSEGTLRGSGRMRMGSWLLVGALALALMPTAAVFAATPARAYGNTALWQIAISGNCDNKSLCGAFGPVGGFWVWAEFDSGGTGDVTVTDCAHFLSTAPFGGAQHVN